MPESGQPCVPGNPGWFWVYTSHDAFQEPIIDIGIHQTFLEVAIDARESKTQGDDPGENGDNRSGLGAGL